MKPHEQIAQLYMEHKGYPDIQPVAIEPLENDPCWYFVYELAEGTLELEVFWDGAEWHTNVVTFSMLKGGPEQAGRPSGN
jgi:hypothetical protein